MKSVLDETTQGYTVPAVPRPTPPLEYHQTERPTHSPYVVSQYPYQYPDERYGAQAYPNNSYAHRIPAGNKPYSRPPDRPGTSRSVVVTRVGPAEVLGSSAAMASQIITSLPNAAYPDRTRQGPSQVYTHPLASSQAYTSPSYRYDPASHADFSRRPRAPAAHRPETPKGARRPNKLATSNAALIRAEAPTTLGETLAREDVWNPDEAVVYGRTSDPIPHRDLLSDCAYIKRVENPYRAHRASELPDVPGEHQIYRYRNEAYDMRPDDRRKCNGASDPRSNTAHQSSPRQPDRRLEDVLDLSLKTVRQSADSTAPDDYSCQPLQLTTKTPSMASSPANLHSQDSNGVSASTSQAPSPQLRKRTTESPGYGEAKHKVSRYEEPTFMATRQYEDLRSTPQSSSLDPARGYTIPGVPPPEIASKYPNLSVSNTSHPQSFQPIGHEHSSYPNSSYSYYTPPPQQLPNHRIPETSKEPAHSRVPSTSATQRRHVLLDTSLYVNPTSKTNHVTVLNKPTRPSSANRDSPRDARASEITESRSIKSESPRSSDQSNKVSPVTSQALNNGEDGRLSANIAHGSRENTEVSVKPEPSSGNSIISGGPPGLKGDISGNLKTDKTLNHLKENCNVNGEESRDKAIGILSDMSGKENKLPLKAEIEIVDVAKLAEPIASKTEELSKTVSKESVDTNSGSGGTGVAKALNLSREPAVSIASLYNRSGYSQSSEPEVIDLGMRPKSSSHIEHKPYADSPQAKPPINITPAHHTSWETSQYHKYPSKPDRPKETPGPSPYDLPQSYQSRQPQYSYTRESTLPWGHSRTTGHQDPLKDPYRGYPRPSEASVSLPKHYPPGLYDKPRDSYPPKPKESMDHRWNHVDPGAHLQPRKDIPNARSEHPAYPVTIAPAYNYHPNSLYPTASSSYSKISPTPDVAHNARKSTVKPDWSYSYFQPNYSVPYTKAIPPSSSHPTYDYREAKEQYEKIRRGEISAKTPPAKSPWTPNSLHLAQPPHGDPKATMSPKPQGYPGETYPVPEQKRESTPSSYAHYLNHTATHAHQSSPYYNTPVRPTSEPTTSYGKSVTPEFHVRPRSPRSLIPTSMPAKPARSPHSPTHPPPQTHEHPYMGYPSYPGPSSYQVPSRKHELAYSAPYPNHSFPSTPPVPSQYCASRQSNSYPHSHYSESMKNYPPPPAAHKSSSLANTVVTQSHTNRSPIPATIQSSPQKRQSSTEIKSSQPSEVTPSINSNHRALYPQIAKVPRSDLNQLSHLDPKKFLATSPVKFSPIKNESVNRHEIPYESKEPLQPSIKKESPSPAKSPRLPGTFASRGSLPFRTPIQPPVDVFDSFEKQLKASGDVRSKRSKVLEERYIRKLELQRAHDKGENIDEEELPYYEDSESDTGPVITKFRGKFKRFKDKNKERILLTYASHSDDSDKDRLADDDASDFEQSLIEEINREKRSRRLSPSDSSVSKESTSDAKSTRRRKIATRSEDSSCYSANTESESSSDDSESSLDGRSSRRKRSRSSSSSSVASTSRRVTRRSKNLRSRLSVSSDPKKTSRRHLKRKARRANRSSLIESKRKSGLTSGSSEDELESMRRKKRIRISIESESDSSSTSKRRSHKDSILEKLDAQRKRDASRRDVIEMRSRQEEDMKSFADRLKLLPETPLRYSWRRPSFVSSFKKGWQADLRRYKLTVARTPKSLVSIPTTPTTDRKQRGRSLTKLEPEIKKENQERSTGFVMQEFFSKVMGERLGDDDSIPRPPLSPCSTFTPTGLTPTPSVEPSMLIPGVHDSDRDSLANLRDPSPPMSDSAALRRRSIVSSLMKKLQSHTTNKKSRLSDIHWLNKSRPMLKPQTRPQKLPTPAPLESSDDGSQTANRKKNGPLSRFRSIFGEDPPSNSSTPSPKLSLETSVPLRRKSRIIAIYYPNSASSAPSTPVGADDASPTSVGQHPGKKRKTKKFRSGLDYIPKKKKKFKEEDVPSATKKRLPARKKFLWPEDSRDVAGEVRGWVINKGLGETVLHKAARLQYHDVVVYCLESGDTDVNARDNAGYTPLHEACNRGHYDIVQALLAYGARVNAPGYRGMRPLHEACDNGHVDVVRILMRYGADINLTSYAGQPCLAVSDDACGKLIQSFTADIKGWKGDPWSITGPASCFDNDGDKDCLEEIPTHAQESTDDAFLFESSSVPLPPTYHVVGKDGKYMLMRDVLNLTNLTRDELIKAIGSISTLTLNSHELKTKCHRLDGVPIETKRRSKYTVFVKYTPDIGEYLKIDSDYVC